MTPQQKQIIQQCQKSVSWFINTFGRIKHPSAGIIPFKLFSYQKHALKSFRQNRFTIFKKCRQSGLSTISGAFALWFAMFHNHKTILIVSRTDDAAMRFLAENVKIIFENLPPWMKAIWKDQNCKWTDHEIHFPNGSYIKSLTSHPEVLRSNASSLNIIDEAAFIQGMDILWAAGYSTLQHGGSVIVVSTCVAPDTLVMTANGLCEIQDLAPANYDGYEDGYHHADYTGPAIAGINGLEPATKFYKRNREQTSIIRTSCGYHFEASLRHKLPVVLEDGSIGDRFVEDLKVGDYLPVKAGQMVFGNDDHLGYVDSDRNFKDPTARTFTVETMDTKLAYLLGVLTAEGHVRKEEVCLACGDASVLDKCESWRDLGWNRGRKDQDYVTISRRPMFVRFLQWLGVELTTAPHKTIPKRLLQCSEPMIREFLKGLFDGDGFAATRNGQPGLVSTSYKLIKQVRMLLFNYGIHTYLETVPPGETTFKRKDGSITRHATRESYKLIVSSNFIDKFYDCVGFDLDRKQNRKHNHKAIWSELMPPVTKDLLKGLKDTTDLSIAKMTKLGLAPNVLYGARQRITKNRLSSFLDKIDYSGNPYYDKLCCLLKYDWFNCITELQDSENETYDFTLPETHTFIGDCTVHANTNGIGNWYWSTWTDAEAGINQFNPILINWWDMDWVIQYIDPMTGKPVRISPLDGLKQLQDPKAIDKYGPYWSPWLEEQWKGLQERGEGWKFQQEVLASFIGSGNTVLPPAVLQHTTTTISDEFDKIDKPQIYVHPVSGEQELLDFDFDEPEEGLWLWEKPVRAKPAKKRGDTVVEPGEPAHSYVMGVDTATGKGRDYHGIEILDIGSMQQVAELMCRCLPRDLVKLVDYLGRQYNDALVVFERNNGGDILIDELRYVYMYPRLWRKKGINDKPRPNNNNRQRAMKVADYGFGTSVASKPKLNKLLLDYIRDDDDGYVIKSRRLLKQMQIYVRKKDRLGRDTQKTEAEDGAGNHDDLVMALGLALMGVADAFAYADYQVLQPMSSMADFKSNTGPVRYTTDQAVKEQTQMITDVGGGGMMPIKVIADESPEISIARYMDELTLQLGAVPAVGGVPIITPKKYYYDKK